MVSTRWLAIRGGAGGIAPGFASQFLPYDVTHVVRTCHCPPYHI